MNCFIRLPRYIFTARHYLTLSFIISSVLLSFAFAQEMNLPKDQIIIGTKVKIQDLSDQEIYEYTLVGSEETDPAMGKISVHSPIAQGILGHKVEDVVEVPLPGGKSKFKILSIVPAI